MSIEDQLVGMLEYMVRQGVPDAEQARDLAVKLRDQLPTTLEVLDALVPGSRVRDQDGDVWRKRKDGEWRFKAKDGTILSSKQLLHVWGPVQVLPWKAKK